MRKYEIFEYEIYFSFMTNVWIRRKNPEIKKEMIKMTFHFSFNHSNPILNNKN